MGAGCCWSPLWVKTPLFFFCPSSPFFFLPAEEADGQCRPGHALRADGETHPEVPPVHPAPAGKGEGCLHPPCFAPYFLQPGCFGKGFRKGHIFGLAAWLQFGDRPKDHLPSFDFEWAKSTSNRSIPQWG